MNLVEYIQQAQKEAFRQHIKANSVVLNSKIKLVREGYTVFHGSAYRYPPMICGLSAYLTDDLPEDLPDNIAFALIDNPNPPLTTEAEIKQKARQEFLDELRNMTFEEIADLIEKGL